MSSLPADILADERLKALSPAKRAALEAMLLARKQQSAAADRITPRDASEKQALSFAEQRLWLLDQLEPSHPFYNMPLAARLAGDLDEAAFAEALQTLTDRHETLRYAYDTLAGEPRRRIADQVRVSPELIDLRGQSPSESEQAALLRDAARVPFDLSKPPLLRCHIYQLADDERIILLVMHHIVSDGWSMWVMLNELAALYEAALAGLRGEACATTLLPLPIQYSDYAVWQREQLSGERREKQIDYWRSRLADAPPSLELPTDYPRTPTQDFDGAVHDFRFSAELSEQIRQAAEATGATPFMLLMAAYQVWLARHTGRRDLCVGTVVAGRPRTELERLIGFFVNTLALRGDLTGDPTFGELVEQVRTETLGAFSHQDLPFEQVIEAVAPDRDRSHEALFQTALVVQNPPRDFARSEGLELTPLLVDNGTAKYDLTFFFWEDAGRWQGQIEYRTSLFEQTTIERFLATFQTLLADALSRQDVPASRLRLLDAEQQATLARWNQTEAPLEEPLLIHDVVLQQTQSKADDAAIRYQGKTTTYAELDEQSRQIAGKLQAAGVSVDDPVLVCLPRSAESVVAMLGIWRAGGVYVPVDLQSAAKRLGYLADDCGAKWVVTNQEVETPPDVTQLDVAELMAPADVTLSDPQLSPQSRAYVIYTSGSTGQPKGVEIEHRSIVNFVRAQTMTMGVTESDHVLHAMSPAFDGGLSVALLAIANGSTLVVADHEQTLDPAALTQLLTSEAVTVGKFTPALLATLDPTQLPGLKSVLSAGDLLTGDLAARWQPGRRFFNGYGPTEVTVGVSIYELPGPPTAPPPIGPPMPNMRAYVLDEHLQQVPIGVTGEICIGGAGVARGYLSRPDETAAKFLPDPFASANPQLPSPRMYRTGDLGRWRSDGVLEFVGRVDDQVQIRGYRVEPGEVTGALESLPEVSQAYTCVHSDPATGDRLVAYVVPASEHASAVHENSDATIGAVEGEHLKSWQTLMEQTHQATGALRDVEFDVTGWVSTFTGLPIPKEEMRAWAAATQDRVLELEPQDVLEIGCGGGLILLGVAPHCRSYVGTDFLARSIDQLSGVLDRKPEAWTKSVKLYKQPAHEVASGPLAGRLFDTIVLNSVVQYFPTVDYLLEVLQAATKLLRPGGKILLGDLRNLQLQEAMAAAVEMRRADAGLSRRELLGRVESRIRHEEELLISPELFDVLDTALPRLSGHTLQLKTGGAANELTRYRYDVVLHFDEPADQAATQLAVIDASAGVDVMETVAKFAASDQSAAAICDIENPRVAADVAAWRRLRDAANGDDASPAHAASVTAADTAAIDPDAWREAVAQHADINVEIRWASSNSPERYDVVLRRPSHTQRANSNTGEQHEAAAEVDWRQFTNRPLDEKRTAQLAPRLRDGLADQLPSYMLPAAYVLMDALPTTVQGKVDRDALPPPPTGRPAWTTGYVEPANKEERLVARVWEEMLGLSPVGAEDDFFELGGHSMLAVRVMAEIEERSGVPIPLAALFQEPTVRHLAKVLSDPDAAEAASSLIPLQASGDGTPLFCIHPAGGTVFCYKALAAHFAGERPVIGVQALGVDGRRAPHETMDAMADYYAGLLKKQFPNGPYHVCGWSLGGNIAYAVAAKLRAAGETVGLVGLFDAGATPPEESLSEDDLGPLLQALFPDFDHLPVEELRQLSPEEQVAYFTERASQAGLVDAAQLASSKHVYSVFQKNVQAVHQHRTGKFDGCVTLFRAAEQTGTNPLADDPLLGWGELAGDVETHAVPSDHTQMMHPPQVDKLASMVRDALGKAEKALDATRAGV